MKNTVIIISTLFSAALWSCTESDPVELSFEDVYGRPGWEIETADTTKYYYIARENDLTWEQVEGTGDASYVYKLSTTGSEPSITTQRLLTSTSAKVLSFKYKSSKTITPFVQLDLRDEETLSKMWDMEAATEWTDFTFDMSIIAEMCGWGTQGSSVKITFGNEPGIDIEIKDIEVRNHISPEQRKREAFYWLFENGKLDGGMSGYDNLTDPQIKTYGAQTYSFVCDPSSSYSRACADPRAREITADENQIHFEYMCDEPVGLVFWWRVEAGYSTDRLELPAAQQWTSAYMDVSDFTATIFAQAPDLAGPINGEAAIDLYKTTTSPFYIRGMRIETN